MKHHDLNDKITCIDGTRQNLESGRYPRMKASISFNSLTSRIDSQQQPDLLDTFKTFLGSSAFYDDSRDYGEDLTPWCGDDCE